MDKESILRTVENTVIMHYINNLPSKKIAFKNLNAHFASKDTVLGVYFVFDAMDNLIYVGQSGAHKKSASSWGLANRINQHQTKSDTGAKNFGVSPHVVRNTYSFSYFELSDAEEIKNLEIFFIGIFSRVLRFNKFHKIRIFS